MSLNPKFIPFYNLEQYFVDKTTLGPLSGGKVYFWSDINRPIPKTVYELSSQTGSYTYVPLPNPVTLGNDGTPNGNSLNDIVIYGYPFDNQNNVELYYITVYSASGVPQWTREAVLGEVVGSTPGTDANLFNYIPNGQFLAHTNVPNNGLLVGGSNDIAQGGFTSELNNPVFSNNTYTFLPLGFTENPTNSPRYLGIFNATTISGSDSYKSVRIKFDDVNKFCANNDFYTFAFWGSSNVNIPISINVVKYFGTNGSPTQIITKFTDVITTTGQTYQYQFQFGGNDGEIIDLVNNNDFIAIDISLPLNIGFIFQHTDFVLANGQQTITSFPLQTNADMIARGIFGWANLPRPNGYDLYLPPILTRYGMTWDYGVIGKIEFSSGLVVSPNSVSPLPITNDMPFASGSYIYNNFSSLGIPFARLGDFLIAQSPVPGVPLFGTGDDFATAYAYAGVLDAFRLSVNKNGVGVSAASDATTGFNIGGIVTYGGSTTGSISLGYNSYSNVADTILAVGMWGVGGFPDQFVNLWLNPPSNGTTPFTVTQLNLMHGYLTQQESAFTLLCTPAATLVAGVGNPGLYWTFSSDTTNFYMWFLFNGEIDPAPGGTGIQVTMNTNYTAQDVANIVREVMNAYQMSNITVTTIPLAGQYWLFSTNPGSIQNYYVWYTVNGAGVDPAVPGRIGIVVPLISGETNDTVASKTRLAIDIHQYSSPPQPGMFLRGIDFDGVWDEDVANRWSSVSGVSGAHVGTFEYSQFLSHSHQARAYAPTPNLGNTGLIAGAGDFIGYNNSVIDVTGGTETRPVNMYATYVIKY